MPDIRESFPILETSAQVGAPITQVIPDTTAASAVISTMGTPVFKSSSGILTFPQLTSTGAIAVDTQANAGIQKYIRGVNTPGSLTEVAIATLTLSVNKIYDDISFLVSCRRGTYFRLAWNDNASITTLADSIVDSGQYTFFAPVLGIKFTAGATGTQQLIIYGTNLDKVSDMRATITAIEF